MLEFTAGVVVALTAAYVADWLAGRRARVGWRHEQASRAATDLIRASSRMAFYRLEGSNLREALAEMYVADTVVRAHFDSQVVGRASALAHKAVSAAESRNGTGDSSNESEAVQAYTDEVDAFIASANQELGISRQASTPWPSKVWTKVTSPRRGRKHG